MEKLGIDTKIMIAQIVNFVVLLFLFSRYVYKPFLNMLKKEEKQKKDTEKALVSAQKKEADLSTLERELKEKYETQTKEAYAQMKKEMAAAKKAILDEAYKEAADMKERTNKLLEAEREKMTAEMKKESFRLARALVEKASGEVLSDDLHKKISADIIKRLPKIKA
jgi:F-type H+-transporting ATPase subunit b